MQIITARFLQVAFGSIAMIVGMETFKPAIATAPTPPNVYPATLNNKPVYVLSMTRSGDTVLVRCYPGQKPNLVLMPKPGGIIKEGMLVCGP